MSSITAQAPSATIRPQKYTYLCVLDFEASINRSDDVTYKHEMIEFPLVLVSTSSCSPILSSLSSSPLPIIAEFHAFIRPQRNRNLHTKLDVGTRNLDTSLGATQNLLQDVLSSAPPFSIAWQDLLTFLAQYGVTSENTLLITCGDWDLRSLLPFELSFHGIENIALFERWCNLKHLFSRFTGKKADSMVRMLNVAGLELVGRHHSGIDDARNIVQVVQWLLQRGCVFTVTSDGDEEEGLDGEEVRRREDSRREKQEAKKMVEIAKLAKLEVGELCPREMFRDESIFENWDENGIPTCWADGTLLSKSAINKRRKMWRAQQLLHEKFLAWQGSDEHVDANNDRTPAIKKP